MEIAQQVIVLPEYNSETMPSLYHVYQATLQYFLVCIITVQYI